MDEIEKWRRRIDELDRELTKLLNKRIEYAIEIGRIKANERMPVYDPAREEQVIHNVQSSADGPLTPDATRRLFERIIDETRRTERQYFRALTTSREEEE